MGFRLSSLTPLQIMAFSSLSAADDTLALLAKHHRGPEFAELMTSTAPGRFGADFWHFWDRTIAPALPLHPCLLDLGTGPGSVLRSWADRYPSARLWGVDLMPYMLERARENLAGIPQVELVQADLHDPQLPLAAGSVDAVQAVMVLHEMVQPIRLLQAAYRLLKPGGRMLIVDWVRAPIQFYFDEATVGQIFDPQADLAFVADRIIHFCEHNRYSSDDLVWMLEHVGFRGLEVELYNQNRFVRIAAQR